MTVSVQTIPKKKTSITPCEVCCASGLCWTGCNPEAVHCWRSAPIAACICSAITADCGCGADLSLTALKQAARAKPVHYLVADAERLYCFKKASLDHVLCSEVIEHCLHPQDIMNGMAHILAPGGEALITTPNARGKRPQWLSIGVMRDYGVRSEWENGQYFHTAYRPEELETMASKAGLTVLESGTFEKDVKYAAKIPAALLLLGRRINRLFHSPQFAAVNEAFFQNFQVFIYQCCTVCGLDKVLLKFVKEGVRTFIRVQNKFQVKTSI
ncbi:MAG: methyltransferase domain-containing protein [candidate division KSB1 bacterium]|nr:methyltransferase domain-containing protein [candidate division KSB1 bacterium]